MHLMEKKYYLCIQEFNMVTNNIKVPYKSFYTLHIS